jgi:hypothetical protein
MRNETLSFVPGGFVWGGRLFPLSGKPLAVLRALAEDRWRTRALTELQSAVWNDDLTAEATVRVAVSAARKALRDAAAALGLPGIPNPIPTADRGEGLTAWRLDLPEFTPSQQGPNSQGVRLLS